MRAVGIFGWDITDTYELYGHHEKFIEGVNKGHFDFVHDQTCNHLYVGRLMFDCDLGEVAWLDCDDCATMGEELGRELLTAIDNAIGVWLTRRPRVETVGLNVMILED